MSRRDAGIVRRRFESDSVRKFREVNLHIHFIFCVDVFILSFIIIIVIICLPSYSSTIGFVFFFLWSIYQIFLILIIHQ